MTSKSKKQKEVLKQNGLTK
ncbi:hypothetical protein [Bacillus changyiensis]|nr:hypothetical protein [Bacillus changyiensis]MDA1477055.1 hypothetical protein [Bacillus changyiensis]